MQTQGFLMELGELSPLAYLFERRNWEDPHIFKIVQNILSNLGKGGMRLAELNSSFHYALTGQKFTFLQGVKDRYALLRGLNRKHADEILHQTGRKIEWPQGQSTLLTITNFDEDPQNKFCLARGNFGILCIGYAFTSKRWVGIKVTQGTEEIEAEYRVQQSMEAVPNIVIAEDICKATGAQGHATLYQIMDLAGLGSVEKLRNVLFKLHDHTFANYIRFYLAKDFLLGLHFMHASDLFHLDAKLENFVVNHKGKGLIIDFGCSQKGSKGQVSGLNSNGDLRYFSPERWLASYGIGDLCDGGKIDAWAAGMALLELFREGPLPFEPAALSRLLSIPAPKGSNHYEVVSRYFEEQLTKVKELERPNQESIWAVIKGLLTIDPQKRQSIAQALQSPWLVLAGQEAFSHRKMVLSRLRELIQSQPFESPQPSQGLAYASGSSIRMQKAIGPQGIRALSPQELPLPHFTDYERRPQLEKLLKEQLLSNKGQTVSQGMGGVGKSQLALYLLHSEEIKAHFGIRLWFRASDQISSLDNQVFLLASELGLIDGKATPEEALTAFHKYFSKQTKPYLVVFDNADDPKLLAPYLPQGKGHLLITTRNGSWPDRIPVGVLGEGEAVTLITHLLHKEDPDAKRLAKTLGFLPLALVQSCAYIRNQNVTISNYLTLLQKHETTLIQENQALFGKELPVSMGALWETTFIALQRSCPEALDLLDSIAYLAPDNIPKYLIFHLFSDKPLSNDSDIRHALFSYHAENKRSVIDNLLQYALLTQEGESYSIHRISQAARRSKQDPKAKSRFFSVALEAFVEAFEVHLFDNAHIRAFLPQGAFLEGEIANHPPLNSQKSRPLLKIFYGKMGRGNERLEQYQGILFYCQKYLTFSKQLKDLAGEGQAYSQLGNAYGSLGEYQKAIKCHKDALNIARGLKDLSGQGKAYAHLGIAYLALQEYLKAVQFHMKSLEIAKQLGDLAWTGRSYGNLGNAYVTLGDHPKAIECHESHLDLAIKLRDTDGEAAAYGNLGIAYWKLGEYPKAVMYHEKQLVIALKLESANRTLSAYGNLGLTHKSLREYEKAIGYFEKALDLALRLESKAAALGTYHHLAKIYQTLEDYSQAIRYYEKALEVARELKDGAKERGVCQALGDVCQLTQSYQQAIGYYQSALNVTSRLKDMDGLEKAYGGLGFAYAGLGEYQAAIKYHKKALEIVQKLKHLSEVPLICLNIGFAYEALGDYTKAIEYHKKALEGAHTVGNAAQEWEASSYIALAYETLEEYGKAIEYHQKALEAASKLEDLSKAEGCYCNLGVAHRKLGKFDEAIEYYEKALKIALVLQDVAGIGGGYYNIGIAYEKLEKFDKAIESFKEASRIFSRLLGTHHPQTVEALKGILRAQRQLISSRN